MEKGARGQVVPHLEAWRQYNALTQRELAERSDVGLSTVIRAEKGESIRASNIRQLASALGVSVQQLLYEAPIQASKD